MSNYLSLVKKIGLVGISNILISINSILLIPILTKSFSIQDYGIWVQTVVTIGLVPILVTLGLPEALMRFLAAEKDKNKIKEDFYSVLFISLVSGILISLIFILFSKEIANLLFNHNIHIAILLPILIIFVSLSMILLSFFRTFQEMKRYSFFTLLQSYLTLLFVSYCAFSNYNIDTTIFSLLIAYIIVFLLMIILIVSDIGFKMPDFRRIREYLSFSLPNLSNNLSSWIIDSSDRYVIGLFLGTAFVGYYSPSYTLAYVITLFATPFNVLLLSMISKFYDEKKIDQVKIIVEYSIKYFLAIAIPLVFILSILSKTILTIFSTPEIANNGYLVTPFIAVSSLFLGLNLIISQIIILKKKTKVIGAIGVFIALLNLILNIILVPFIGILGSAIVTLISYSIYFLLILFYSLKYFKYKMELQFILKSLTASIIMSLFIVYFYPKNSLGLFMIIGISLIIYIMLIFILKGFTHQEIKFFKKILSK